MYWKHWLGGAVAVTAIAFSMGTSPIESAETKQKSTRIDEVAQGRELFMRQWLPNDPRSHGDGLGPVFNETSCVACHNQGGPGGAGASSQNVDIVSVSMIPGMIHADPQPSFAEQAFRSVLGLPPQRQPKDAAKRREVLKASLEAELKRIHPGFLNAQSLVVHKYSVHDQYEPWRQRLIAQNQQAFFSNPPMMATPAISVDVPVEAGFAEPVPAEALEVPAEPFVPEGGQPGIAEQASFAQFAQGSGDQQRQLIINSAQMRRFNQGNFTQHGRFFLSTSQRNTTSLFGTGLLDSIPDEVLKEQAAKKFEGFPEITGRVSKLKDGKIGRFGWKCQTASLEDFALTACAVELGLDVPGHTQAGLAYDADYRAPGHDMTREECNALVAFLKDLPAPVQETSDEPGVTEFLHEGKALFATVGCANCHTENLGEVAAVYSDLLLHDMGDSLQDQGDYGVFVPESPGGDLEPIIEQLIKSSEQAPQQVAMPTPGQPTPDEEKILGAKRNEWRTPPLWGVRDSAPYLHDGRAQSIEEAIAFHDGEARRSANKFFELTPTERLKLVMFLKSLTAPDQLAAK